VSRRLGWLRDHHRAVSLITGSMLVVVGFLMITNTFGRLSGVFAPLGL
jgi:cytochrome c-type biogenesis protein